MANLATLTKELETGSYLRPPICLGAATPVSRSRSPLCTDLIRRHGDSVRENDMSGASELILLGGHVGRHIDPFCHVTIKGRLHGDVHPAVAALGRRVSAHRVETIAPVVRGAVLLVIRAVRVRDAHEPGKAVTADGLVQAAESRCTRFARPTLCWSHGVAARRYHSETRCATEDPRRDGGSPLRPLALVPSEQAGAPIGGWRGIEIHQTGGTYMTTYPGDGRVASPAPDAPRVS